MASMVVRLSGGLGNQLHGYAFGQALEYVQNRPVFYDVESAFWADSYRRCYLLDSFPNLAINKIWVTKNEFLKVISRISYRLGRSVSNKLPFAISPYITEPYPLRYRPEILSAKYLLRHKFYGCWASYHYCKLVESQLKYNLSPPVPNKTNVTKWLDMIKNSPSCFIHFRSYKEESGGFRPFLGKYYSSALSLARTQFPGIQFYVFSDCIHLASQAFATFDFDINYVEIPDNEGDINSLNDFYLMYSCDHAILGDSTFSWWAAWLSDRHGKLVVAPQGLSPWGDDWAPPHWTKLVY